LVFLMGVGTLISWKKATWKNFRRNFLAPVLATLVLAPLLCAGYWFLRAQHLDLTLVPKETGYAIGAVFASVFVFCATASEYWRGIEARMRSREEGVLEAALNLLSRQRRRYGGYIVHMGFILAVIGFSGAAFKVEQDVTMRKGEMVDLGDYLVRYDGLSFRQDREKELAEATLTVLAADGVTEVSVIKPAKASFYSSPESPTSEIAIDTGPIEDLYFALAGFGENGEVASFKMVIGPLVWWFWFGGTVLIFGTLICLWPEGAKMPTSVYIRAARGGASLVLLTGLSFAPLAVWTMEADAQPAAGDHDHVHDDEGGAGKGPSVRVHDPRLKRLMTLIRIECAGQGNPIMANSKPTCPDYQRDLALLEKMITEGKSDDEILAKFVEMRGEEVLAVPPDKDGNWLAWAIPLGILVVSVPLLSYKVVQWSRNTHDEAGALAKAADEGDLDESDASGLDYEERLRRELSEL
ncbi:MAG: cytochrome c-type biogenesis CcmF C-terminal domain-containing protein, partial [Myxococcota bacterium]